MAKSYYCKRCNHTLREDQFYGTNNLEKYPEGKLDMCKQCVSAHVDNWDPNTYVWILQECDVPYVPDEWNKLMASYGKDPSKMTGLTILGRYLSKMKLKQYKDFRFKDTEFIQQLADSKMEETMKRQGYDIQEITMALEKNKLVIPEEGYKQPEYDEYQAPDDYFAFQSGITEDFDLGLSEEDVTHLRLKWGKTYKPEEWVKLEQLYEDMMASYDIQGAGHIDTLKLVCKTSLKANQLIDMGDVEGFQKMQKAYDSLMKSGNFTAAQNKAESGDFVDSIGELIELCEKQGYIERYYIDQPKDKVDLTIADMQRYTKTLIEEETNLPIMIEKALREIEKEDQEQAENTEDTIVDDIDMSLEDIERIIKDQDFIDFEEFLDEEAEADALYLEELENE